MFYSASLNMWFDPRFRADYERAGTWPTDAVEYPHEVFDAVVSNRPPNKVMLPDAAGRPALQDPTPPSADAIWEDIKAERDRRIECSGFQVAGKWYHSDVNSKLQHLGNKDTARDQLAAGGTMVDPLRDPLTGQPIPWKTMDGSWQPLTVQLVFDIVNAGKAAELAHHAAAERHRTVMESGADPASYDYASGWPPSYQPPQ